MRQLKCATAPFHRSSDCCCYYWCYYSLPCLSLCCKKERKKPKTAIKLPGFSLCKLSELCLCSRKLKRAVFRFVLDFSKGCTGIHVAAGRGGARPPPSPVRPGSPPAGHRCRCTCLEAATEITPSILFLRCKGRIVRAVAGTGAWRWEGLVKRTAWKTG